MVHSSVVTDSVIHCHCKEGLELLPKGKQTQEFKCKKIKSNWKKNVGEFINNFGAGHENVH